MTEEEAVEIVKDELNLKEFTFVPSFRVCFERWMEWRKRTNEKYSK